MTKNENISNEECLYRLREKKEVSEVEWKKAKEIADSLGISRLYII